MKTTEQKLLLLLQIAVNNGWEDSFLEKEVINRLSLWKFFKGFKEVRLSEPKTGKIETAIYFVSSLDSIKIDFNWYEIGFNTPTTLTQSLSLDHLISKWDHNQISFLEALHKALIDKVEIYGTEFKSYKLLFGSDREVWINSPKDLYPSTVREYWIDLPSSKRLNSLFELFKLLIDEN